MEKYNRDLHTKGLESYEVPQYEGEPRARLDLVFGFVAGAVLGSALGLILKPTLESDKSKTQSKKQNKLNKVNDQDTALRDEAKRKADALKEQARRVREDSKRQRSALTDTDDPSSKELAAQRRAIQSEVDSDRLEGQTAKQTASATSSDAEASDYDRNRRSGEDEVKVEHSDKSRTSTGAATAGVATAGVTAAGVAHASDQHQTSKSQDDNSEVSSDALSAQKRAIRSEVDSDRLEGQTGPTTTAESEESKQSATDKTSQPSSSSLGAQRRLLDMNQTKASETDQKEHNVRLENGVITHDKDKDDFELSNHNQTVSEEAKKTNSKVDKHTFDQ